MKESELKNIDIIYQTELELQEFITITVLFCPWIIFISSLLLIPPFTWTVIISTCLILTAIFSYIFSFYKVKYQIFHKDTFEVVYPTRKEKYLPLKKTIAYNQIQEISYRISYALRTPSSLYIKYINGEKKENLLIFMDRKKANILIGKLKEVGVIVKIID